MLRGINIDITNKPPDPGLLLKIGCKAVRFPSRRGTSDYIADLHEFGIYTLCVIDEVAAGFVAGGGACSAYQITNEIDVKNWSFERAREEMRIYRETYPELVLVAPGLAAGDYNATYLKGIVQALRDYRYAAIALHPYNKTPTAAVDLLRATRKVDPALPILFTECHPEADDLRQFYYAAQTAGCAGVFYHCWTDAMTLESEGLRFGLVDENGNHKRELGYWIFS